MSWRSPAFLGVPLATLGLVFVSMASATHIQGGLTTSKPYVLTDRTSFAGCSSCLAHPSKKFCTTTDSQAGAKSYACCNVNDFDSDLCNSHKRTVTCSDSFG